jgi:hypothetical protein
MVKYPEITIPLVGEDGNAFSILARCQTAMKRNGLREEIATFHAEATAGDYDNLLRTVMAWFSVGKITTDKEEDDYEEEFYARHPHGCFECGEFYAVGGCPSCGE